MGSGYYVRMDRVTVSIHDWDYERGPSGSPRSIVRYWAVVSDDSDPQYPIDNCGHDHREIAAAIRCRDRLMRKVRRLFDAGMAAADFRVAMRKEQ